MKKYYVLTAIAAYLIILGATVPAHTVSKLVEDNLPVTIRGISGTLWQGQAYSITIDNAVTLKDTRWSFTAWKLLLGRAALDLDSHYLENPLTTELGISFTGTLFVNGLSAQMAASDLAELTNIPLAQLAGDIDIAIEHASWSQGEIPRATGTLDWSKASVTITETAQLGNINISLHQSEQETMLAELSNQGGDIQLSGNAELASDANYTVDLRLKPTATASNSIRQSLGMFAQKQSNGDYLLKKTGSLSQLGIL